MFDKLACYDHDSLCNVFFVKKNENTPKIKSNVKIHWCFFVLFSILEKVWSDDCLLLIARCFLCHLFFTHEVK